MPSLTVAQLAAICGGHVEGDGAREIEGADSLESATASDLSFISGDKFRRAAGKSKAGCLLAPETLELSGPWSLIRVREPRMAFARALQALYPQQEPPPSIHPTAVVALTATIEPDCFIGPYVVIGEHAHISGGCRIGNGSSIGDRVQMGPNTTIHPNVTIYANVKIGARVLIHAGCVLGADGFGFTLVNGRYEKFPQVGSVEIADDVELGANCCVDRAALGITRIGRGSKFDNLVHIAHNCTIGEHVVVAAQTGFSGSVTVGDYAAIGGQAGIGEKAIIESRAVVGGKSGILTGQRVHAGEPVWGIPARPLKQHLKGLAHVARLPELREEVAQLKKRLE